MEVDGFIGGIVEGRVVFGFIGVWVYILVYLVVIVCFWLGDFIFVACKLGIIKFIFRG